MQKKNIAAVILSAGRGERMGGNYKQFLKIKGKPAIFYSLEALRRCRFITQIVVVLPKEKLAYANNLISNNHHDNRIKLITGGDTRRSSSYLALQYLAQGKKKINFVIFQDAVRPLISVKMIKAVLVEAKKHGAATLGIRAVDTIGKIENSFMINAPDREELFHVHLPQCYRFAWIRSAHLSQKNKAPFLKDAENSVLMTRAGKKIKVIFGFYPNTKLTFKEDIKTISSLSI